MPHFAICFFLCLAICLPAAQCSFLAFVHKTFAGNKMCGLLLDHAHFSEQCTANTTVFNERILGVIDRTELGYYSNDSKDLESRARDKLTVIAAFLDNSESPLCKKLCRFDGYFFLLQKRHDALPSVESRQKAISTYIYWNIVKYIDFYALVASLFEEFALEGFVWPSKRWINANWNFCLLGNYQSATCKLTPSHYERAFSRHLTAFVNFYIEFYNLVRPTDTKVFLALLKELGMSPLESVLPLRLMLPKEGALATFVADLKYVLANVKDADELAEQIVSALLAPATIRQILLIVQAFDSSESIKTLHLAQGAASTSKVSALTHHKFIDEVSVKCALLNSIHTRISSNLRDTAFNDHLFCQFFVELATSDSCCWHENIKLLFSRINPTEGAIDAACGAAEDMESFFEFFDHIHPTFNISLLQLHKHSNSSDKIQQELKSFYEMFSNGNTKRNVQMILERYKKRLEERDSEEKLPRTTLTVKGAAKLKPTGSFQDARKALAEQSNSFRMREKLAMGKKKFYSLQDVIDVLEEFLAQ